MEEFLISKSCVIWILLFGLMNYVSHKIRYLSILLYVFCVLIDVKNISTVYIFHCCLRMTLGTLPRCDIHHFCIPLRGAVTFY